jgi:hypothetical protein
MANWTDHSVSFALQDDLSTPSSLAPSAFVTLRCEPPQVTFSTETSEQIVNKGVVGAAPDQIVGARSGRIVFRQALQTLKTGYSPGSEDPGGSPSGSVEVIPPWLILVANALGCNAEALAGATLADKNTNFWRGTFLSCSAYAAAKVTAAGTDSTHLQMDAGEGANHKAGQLIAAATSTSVAPFLAFVKVKAVDLVDAFDAAAAASANYDDDAANVYGTATAWQSDDQPQPLTCYWTGNNTTFCYVLTGCVCDDFKITIGDNKIPTLEMGFRFFDYSLDKTLGGLIVPDSYVRTPSMVGTRNAIAMFQNAEKCGLLDLAVQWSATSVRLGECYSAPQGISTATIVRPRVRVSCVVAHDSADSAYDVTGTPGNQGSHMWQYALEAAMALSLGVYVGAQVGKSLAFRIPAGVVSATPTIADRDGVMVYAIQMDADVYTGDTTDTAETTSNSPINAVFAIALA